MKRAPARWRAPSALGTVIGAVVLSQGVAAGIDALGGTGRASRFVAFIAADLAMLAVVLCVARRGAERFGPATLGIRRTRLGPAIGWTLTIYFGVIAAEGLWVGLIAGPGGRAQHHHAGAPAAVMALAAIAVAAPIAEEITFRGYLFPALSRSRGPWIGALACALLFGAAHAAVYPPAFLPAMAFFGFGQCLLFWFTGSLLPCIALHAVNNALVAGVLLGLGGFVVVGVVAAPVLALAVVAPLTRERAPRAA